MIKTLTMRNCASYDGQGVTFHDCNIVNYIYGHNGSGKSTISNYLQGMSPDSFNDCSVEWELGTEADILVYNKNFRMKNLQSMPGVFTLGEATAEQIKHIEELKNHYEKRRDELLSLQNSIKTKENEQSSLKRQFEENAWTAILKKNEQEFLDAFSGLRNKKSLFAERVLDIFKSNPSTGLSRDVLVEKARILFGEKPEQLSEPLIPDLKVVECIETDEIWNKAIIGNDDVDIAGLIKSLNNSDWVKAGIKYLRRDGGICPFCQKETIDQDFIKKLELFFSGEFDRQIEIVQKCINEYENAVSTLMEQVASWISSAKTLKIEFDFKDIEALAKNLKLVFEKNIELFHTKHKEPSRRVNVEYSLSVIEKIHELMNHFNARVRSHNELANDFAKQKSNLISEIWALLITENSVMINSYVEFTSNISKALNGMHRKEESLKTELDGLDTQIVEESKNVTSVQPTVDAINRALKAYGFDGFRIIASKDNPNQYQILRPNGTIVADSLSEGEETFISFLYFVYMTRGGLNTDSIDKHKVLIIDDPICSLDSSVLYVVSSLVRELTTCAKEGTYNIDQVFVLTHNVYFHKEISFQDGRNQIDPKVCFWVLNKKNEITSIRSYGNTNPINTTYALLWKEVKESDSISNVSLQNAMRRILENFFGTIGSANIGDILQFFESPEEKSICKSLFSWANDGSHSIPDDLEFSEGNDSSEKYKKVFRDIFYNTQNRYHYDRMME